MQLAAQPAWTPCTRVLWVSINVCNILGVIVPTLKLFSMKGTCTGIALRPHGHHQRSCRNVTG